jgi:hypothetical protein
LARAVIVALRTALLWGVAGCAAFSQLPNPMLEQKLRAYQATLDLGG